jgi:hypothetical protein
LLHKLIAEINADLSLLAEGDVILLESVSLLTWEYNQLMPEYQIDDLHLNP